MWNICGGGCFLENGKLEEAGVSGQVGAVGLSGDQAGRGECEGVLE